MNMLEGNEPQSSVCTLPPGTMIQNKFRIDGLLGVGASSTVYKATSLSLSSTVAIKIIHPQLLQSPGAVQRFQNEAQIIASLNHHNLVKLLVCGEDSEHGHFMALEFVEGKSFAELLGRTVGSANHLLDLYVIKSYFLQLAEAMQHVHDHGLVHRDLKPSNIMVLSGIGSGSSLIKVIDFGISKILPAEGAGAQNLTATNSIPGSPLYMSPEQCAGLALDARSDIYSFGCVLYEALCLKPPFQAESPLLVMSQHLTQAVTKVPSKYRIPTMLEKLVLRCLAKDPADRYASMSEVSADLERIDLAGSQTSGLSANPRKKLALVLACLGAVLVTMVLVGVSGVWKIGNERTQQSSVILPGAAMDRALKVRGFLVKEHPEPPFRIHYYEEYLNSYGTKLTVERADARYYLAVDNYANGNRTAYDDLLKQSLSDFHTLTKEWSEGRLRLSMADRDLLIFRYIEVMTLERSIDAIAEINQILSGLRGKPHSVELVGRLLRDRGDFYAKKGDMANALKSYAESLKMLEMFDCERCDTLVAIGRAHRMDADKTRAIAALDSALQIVDSNQELSEHNCGQLLHISEVLIDCGQFLKAAKRLEQLEKIREKASPSIAFDHQLHQAKAQLLIKSKQAVAADKYLYGLVKESDLDSTRWEDLIVLMTENALRNGVHSSVIPCLELVANRAFKDSSKPLNAVRVLELGTTLCTMYRAHMRSDDCDRVATVFLPYIKNCNYQVYGTILPFCGKLIRSFAFIGAGEAWEKIVDVMRARKPMNDYVSLIVSDSELYVLNGRHQTARATELARKLVPLATKMEEKMPEEVSSFWACKGESERNALNNKASYDDFVKALQIAERHPNQVCEAKIVMLIGQTGICQARLGNHREGAKLLERAIQRAHGHSDMESFIPYWLDNLLRIYGDNKQYADADRTFRYFVTATASRDSIEYLDAKIEANTYYRDLCTRRKMESEVRALDAEIAAVTKRKNEILRRPSAGV